ncbi:MAG: LPS export ABC transporter periplasmic protein LptC [Pseudomonadota bacterium]
MKIRKLQFLFLAVFIGLGVLCAGLFFRKGNSGYRFNSVPPLLSDGADMVIKGVDFTEMRQGTRQWTVQAETLRFFKATNLMVFDQVDVTFYSEDGEYHLTGETGYYYKKLQKMKILGQVAATDQRGNILTAPELVYDAKAKLVSTSGPFKLTGPKLDLQGNGLSIFTEEKRLKVSHQPHLLLKSVENLM